MSWVVMGEEGGWGGGGGGGKVNQLGYVAPHL